MAEGGLEKAFSSVIHPSSNPPIKTRNQHPYPDHESHTQTHGEETLIARRGGKGVTRRTWEQYCLCDETGGLCRLFSCRACQERHGRLSPRHQEGIPPAARHWGPGAMLTAAEGTHTPHHKKNSTVPERPSHAWSCHPHQLSTPEGHPLAGVTDLFPTRAHPMPAFTSCTFAASVFPDHRTRHIPICHPEGHRPEGKVTLLCPAPHLRVPAGLATASLGQNTQAEHAQQKGHLQMTKDGRTGNSRRKDWRRCDLGDHQAGGRMGNVVDCGGMVKKEKGWRWGKLTSRFSRLDSKIALPRRR